MFHVVLAWTWAGNATVHRPVHPMYHVPVCLNERLQTVKGNKQCCSQFALAQIILIHTLSASWGYTISAHAFISNVWLIRPPPHLLLVVFQHDSPASEEGQPGEGAPTWCRVSVPAVQLLHQSSFREDLAWWVTRPPSWFSYIAFGPAVMLSSDCTTWPLARGKRGWQPSTLLNRRWASSSSSSRVSALSVTLDLWPAVGAHREGSSQWGFKL